MSDKEVTEVENPDEMNSTGTTSNSSKESEPENVDAIKKYIEEQEILLRHSSGNVLVNKLEKETPAGDGQNECNTLESQLSSDSQTIPSCKLKKPNIAIWPSMFDSEHLHSGEMPVSAAENPSSSDALLQIDNEENLTNEAAENLLSLSQNCILMQANIKQTIQSDDITEPTVHEQTKPSINTVSEYRNNELSDKLEMNEQVANNTINENSFELYGSNVSPQACEDNLHSSLKNEIKSQELHTVDDSKGMSMLIKSSIASDLETRNMSTEGEYSKPKLLHKLLTSANNLSEVSKSLEVHSVINTVHENKEHSGETLAIATSVMDMILNDAEAVIKKKRVSNALSKQCFSPDKANSSVSLAIGSKVEAKDFCGLWHPAQIAEVDCEEMEVLVQYGNQPKMHNEWISINSPRLRPLSGIVTKPISPPNTPTPEGNTEVKVEDKQKLTFAAGERCLARWRDNRRFIATVQNDLGNGNYEVMFDDGFQWKCSLSRLYRLKESCRQQEYPSFGARAPPAAPLGAASSAAPSTAPSTAPSATSSAAPPAAPPAPALAPAAPARLPVYHTHLFDPTRDYLGSKSERREMKRKLNIKEIFNIGQKRKKLAPVDKVSKSTITCVKEENESDNPGTAPAEIAPTVTPAVKNNSSALHVKKVITKKPPVKKKPLSRKKIKLKNIDVKPDIVSTHEIKTEIPEAVASIIGTVCEMETDNVQVKLEPLTVEIKDSNANDIKPDEQIHGLSDISHINGSLVKQDMDVVIKEETKLFEVQDEVKHEEVIGKIKEVITKLEDGINEVEKNECKPEEIKEVAKAEDVQPTNQKITDVAQKSKRSSKVKKGKKLRLLQEKKVKKQVEKVKCQLEEMKKQVEAMRQEIMLKTEELASSRRGECAADEGALLPGEWCARWRDGQPEGVVSEAPGTPPRRSVQVEDKRLPPGWTKHMVRRSLGTSAGKWDVVIASPENRRIHTKNDMRIYLENNPDPALKPFEAALMDFGIHLKLSRRLGWVRGVAEPALPPAPAPAAPTAPALHKRAKLSLKKNHHKLMHHKKRPKLKIKLLQPPLASEVAFMDQNSKEANMCSDPCAEEATLDGASIKDGFVDVGSLRVQVIETLLRCPAEGCFKNFRNTTLLKMHIKHYHRELRKMMGNTPKVLDLAYARTRPSEADMKQLKREAQQRIIKVKLPRMHKRVEEAASAPHSPPPASSPAPAPAPPATSPPPAPLTPAPAADDAPPKPLDSPKLRNALVNKPVKRPRVLLPVRSKDPEPAVNNENAGEQPAIKLEMETDEIKIEPKQEIPDCGVLDFEAAISTHTVARMVNGRSKGEKRRKTFAVIGKASSDEEWACAGSDRDSRSYPSCGSPDSKGTDDPPRASSPSDDKDAQHLYMYSENGERIKLVRMKREEIINCHCGFREEDGLMVQCELCLCWQHALCHNIQRESEVPEKYTCSICLSPRRGRRRQRFTHDQDRLYEGLLPGTDGGRATDALRRAHELSGNLLRVHDALHAVRVNTRVAQIKNHPKLYLWARDWETVELSFAQEKLNSEYSDLNVIINNLGKENLPIKAEDLKEMALDMKSPSLEEQHGPRGSQLGPQALLSGLLASPAALDLPVSDADLEKLAKSVHEHERSRPRAPAPVPEAAIENSACRARLLRHVQRCHALLDQRLDSIEAQVAELESQDASLEDDETADYYPRTKQTVLMVARDLDTMEELGGLT